jgi:hypothetical protein
MKKVIANNQKIRSTANGQSVVEGSYAKVLVIEGDDNSPITTINGIKIGNRNLWGEGSDKQEININNTTKTFDSNSQLVKLANTKKYSNICFSFIFKINAISNFFSTSNATYSMAIYYTDGSTETSYKNYILNNNSIWQKNKYELIAQIDTTKQIDKIRVIFFSVYISPSVGNGGFLNAVSYNNQIEFSDKSTKYVSSKTTTLNLPQITLRHYGSYKDRYYPETGYVARAVNSSASGNLGNVEYTKEYNPISLYYQVYNNGYEEILTDGNPPNLITEYLIEPNQNGDFSRFDYFMIDGEGFCGIGYEKLKTTNQLTYAEEPNRQQDGSMQNIEDYNTFVLGALEIGFNCINEETYRRLKQRLISKRTFDITYYDKDFDKYITKEMYVKPIDLDNFLSYGDEIIGMNFTMSFVPTMNETTKYTVKFLNGTTTVKEYSGDSGISYGLDCETPELPNGYNYWLMTESPFGEDNFVKIKAKKKLSIFGDTTLIAIP